MPGHALLKERVEASLDRAVEAPDVDFKQSEGWETLKWTIVKAVLGMGNLRDGGLVIIGVSERGDVWELEGVSDEDMSSYDADTMAATFEKFVSPAPAVEVVLHEREAKSYLLLSVRQFEQIPYVCRRDGPEGSGLEDGAFYHRPLGGVPRTERVRSAEDMWPILQLASEEGARRILEQSQRIGLLDQIPKPPSDDDRYDDELEDI